MGAGVLTGFMGYVPDVAASSAGVVRVGYRGYESGVPLPGLAQLLVSVTGLLGVGRQLGELRTVMLG